MLRKGATELKKRRITPAPRLDSGEIFSIEGPEMKLPSIIHEKTSEAEDRFDLEIGGMWSVRAASMCRESLAQHLEDLTCQPNKDKKPQGFGKPKVFKIGHLRVDGRLYMPPWYAKLAFPHAIQRRVMLTRGESMREEVSFSGTLRTQPPQQQAASRYLEWMRDNIGLSCILSLPCGYGKTVLFLALCAALRRVTLVLAHTIALVDQWIEEARAFMPGVRVGYIKDGVMRVEGVDFIVASVQSLRSHICSDLPYVKTLMARVGTVCMDEGHHAVAGTFWEVMSQCPAVYRFVLTATPRRKDGLLSHLQWIAGPVIFRAFRKVDDVHVVSVQYVNEAHVEIRRGKMQALDNAAMVTALTCDRKRTQIAADLACHLVCTQDRRVVIVTPRVEHIHELAELLTSRLEAAGCLRREVDMFIHDKFTLRRVKQRGESKEDCDARCTAAKNAWEDSGPHGSVQKVHAPLVGRVLAGMTTLERDTQYEGIIVVASPNILEEGVSYKKWDTLIDLNNSSDAEQVVGRILRECATKRVPLIVDFWIDVSLFGALYWKRRKYYKAEEFSCRSIKVGIQVEEDRPRHGFEKLEEGDGSGGDTVETDILKALDWEVYNRVCADPTTAVT